MEQSLLNTGVVLLMVLMAALVVVVVVVLVVVVVAPVGQVPLVLRLVEG
jgi:hypothetical protein